MEDKGKPPTTSPTTPKKKQQQSQHRADEDEAHDARLGAAARYYTGGDSRTEKWRE